MRRETKGILWMCLAELIFVAAWVSIKLAGRRLPLFEVTFFRAGSSLVLLAPLVRLRRRALHGRAWGNLFWRAMFGYAAMLLSFYAMIHMDIGNASTLFNTMPIFVALLAPFMLREPFDRRQLLLVVGAFVGIGMLFRADAGLFDAVGLMALGAGLLAAVAMIYVRKLSHTDSALTITFFFTAFAALASLPLAAVQYVPPTPAEWGLIAIIGISTTLGQLFLSHAYKFGHAATIAPFAYVSVVGSYVAGVLLFGEIPDRWSMAGAAIVIACGVLIMLLAPAAQQAAEERA